jgi:hypothetical protein
LSSGTLNFLSVSLTNCSGKYAKRSSFEHSSTAVSAKIGLESVVKAIKQQIAVFLKDSLITIPPENI